MAIDGACLSACTLIAGDRAARAHLRDAAGDARFSRRLGPRAAGQPVHSAAGTRALWDYYPPHVRRWINSRGGLQPRMIFLRGRELAAMYPQCR